MARRDSSARARASSSTSSPSAGSGRTSGGGGDASRCRVSRLRRPVFARLRALPSTTSPAAAIRTITATMMTATFCSYLQLEEDPVVPREHEVEALTAEERPDDDEHCPQHDEHGEDRDGELPVLREMRRVLVDEGREGEEPQPDAGDGHARDHRVEHGEELLEAQEVPRRLRRVRRLVHV